MKDKVNQRPMRVAIMLTIALLLSACSSDPVDREDQQAAAFADLRTVVEGSVSDKARRREVLAIVESLGDDVESLRELLVQRRAELRRLNADYDTTRQELLAYAAQVEADIEASRRTAIQSQLELSAALTDDEWAAIAKAQTQAMRSVSQSLQGL